MNIIIKEIYHHYAIKQLEYEANLLIKLLQELKEGHDTERNNQKISST